MLLRLALLKAGRSLDTGASAIEIDDGKVQMIFVQSGFEPRKFGTEPMGDVPFRVNGDTDLALLDDGMNLNRAEGFGADADMHLRIHLAGRGGIGRDRWSGGGGRRGVEHLVSFGKFGRGIRCDVGWRGRGWRSGSGQRSPGIFPGCKCGRGVAQWSSA